MKIMVNVKTLSKKISSVEPVEFEIEGRPLNARELICACVDSCVKQYNARLRRTEDSAQPLSAEQLADMESAGKVAFGLPFGGKTADPVQARETALLGFEDGLFRMFIDDTEIESAEQTVMLTQNSAVTFIRLTMLAGRMW